MGWELRMTGPISSSIRSAPCSRSVEREPTFSVGEAGRSVGAPSGRTARLDLAEFFAVLDRRDRIMLQCELFLDDYDAWLMPVMPDAAFIRQKQSEPLRIDGVDHPYFFAGTAYNFLANLTGQPSIVLPCGFSLGTACRSACSSPASAGATPDCWASPRCWRRLLPPCPVPPNYA